MNKSFLKTLDKTVEINPIIMSNNGHYYYDLMIDTKNPGYVTASNIVFYCEDETILSEFNKLRLAKDNSLEKMKQFITENSQFLMTLENAKKISDQMYNPMAYVHLNSNPKETFIKMIYGGLHLIKNNEVLIFHPSRTINSSSMLKSITSFNNLKSDFENNYSKVQEILYGLYESGEIKEDFKIIDKAALNIISKIKGFNFYLLSDFQKSSLNIIQNYNNELNQNIKINSKTEKDLLILSFSLNDSNFTIEIPKENTSHFKLKINQDTIEFNNVMSLIINLNEEISSTKVLHFLKKNKSNLTL